MKKSSIILVLVLLSVAAGLLVYFAGRDENTAKEEPALAEKTEKVMEQTDVDAPYGDYSLVEGGVATSEHFMLESTPQNVKK